jgi:hypothetical protein
MLTLERPARSFGLSCTYTGVSLGTAPGRNFVEPVSAGAGRHRPARLGEWIRARSNTMSAHPSGRPVSTASL